MEQGQKIAQSLAELNSLANNPPPAPPQQGSAVQASIPSPGQLVAPAPAAPTPGLGQAVSGGTPDGSLTSNPRQATADTLNILDKKEGLEGQEGEVQSKEQADLAAKQNEAAQEKIQQAKDYQDHLAQANAKYEGEHQQHQAAYDEFRKKAGSLKDPGSQFWEDKGQGSRITAALAAFSSGLGGGLTGHGGNQFMDFLQKQIDNNFNAHKQNIEDLYQSSVEAGKIADSTENHNRFMNEAKLKSYDLASMHINHELEAIKNGASSQIAKVLASKAQAGLEQEGVNARAALAAYEAKQAAAAAAAQRERRKEINAAFLKQVELHNKDMGEDESRLAAFKDLQPLYNRSELAAAAAGLGIQVDPKTGEFSVPKANNQGTAEQAHYDDSGNLVVPTKSATGKLIPPEEQEKLRKDAEERTGTVNGKKVIFDRKEDAEAAKIIPEIERLYARMEKSYKEADVGTFIQARRDFIEKYPIFLGYKRGPSIPQAGETTKQAEDRQREEDRGTIAGQLPDLTAINFPGTPIPVPQSWQAKLNSNPGGAANSRPGIDLHKLAGVKESIENTKKAIIADTVGQTAPPKEEKNKPMTSQELDDLTKQLGGK